jgi:hypothetical protein
MIKNLERTTISKFLTVAAIVRSAADALCVDLILLLQEKHQIRTFVTGLAGTSPRDGLRPR